MAAVPIIQSTGSISGPGAPGVGRNNLVLGETVTLSDTAVGNIGASYVWAFVNKPVGSSSTLTGPTTATPTFIPDVIGSYKLICTVNGSLTSVNIIAVPLAHTAGRIPALGEQLEYDAVNGWQGAMTPLLRQLDTLGSPISLAYNIWVGDTSGSEIVVTKTKVPFLGLGWDFVKVEVTCQALSASGAANLNLRVGGTMGNINGMVRASTSTSSPILVDLDFSASFACPTTTLPVQLTLQSSGVGVDAQVSNVLVTLSKALS